MLFQLLPALALGAGMPFLPDSPRWKLMRGREASAKRSLIRIRKYTGLEVLQELHEMRTYVRHIEPLRGVAMMHRGGMDVVTGTAGLLWSAFLIWNLLQVRPAPLLPPGGGRGPVT